MIICLVVAGLISAIIIAVLQLKRQKAKTDQRQELFEAQEKLMKAQLENKRLSELQLREQLEKKIRAALCPAFPCT
ncbi:hypothetical protein PZB74_17755 [Porifericola rhodea]|uniref:hypothetical protein n=1 Tax=Porifericola rhodea TaxID=930972 RepID=UPI0026658729|nr:hypothetical protein [Porifericola rhodea]WKN30804.1 hypothetical protein PZB74_17755 [Porifericola rhodea]